jgi:DNA repair protein RecN (Recombination protein N)
VLTHLHIRNLAVIDEIDVELEPGLTVLTGETGAGKSILVDALGLALGARADADAVRPGTERAEIAASFEIDATSPAAGWLAINDLDEEEHCLIRRVVTAEGRSRGYINGNPVSMQMLRELGAELVDICGQRAHQSLLRRNVQRQVLDQHGGYVELLEAVANAYRAWRDAESERAALDQAQQDRQARLELLSYQVEELRALGLEPGEPEALEQTHRLTANQARIADGANDALRTIYEDDQFSAQAAISRSQQKLDELATLDPRLSAITALLAEAEIQVTEAAESLRAYLSGLESDPGRLQDLEARLAAVHELARKHRVAAGDLPATHERLQHELEQLQHSDERLQVLAQQTETLQSAYREAATELSAARHTAAASLEAEINDNIQQLGMPAGRFFVALDPPPDQAPNDGPTGYDRIEFNVALNPGHPPGALAKVASGGELSRVSLALQVAAADADTTETHVFDEVDAGVGGSVAEIVGSRLRELGLRTQVLCVTHLAQVASQGHQHLRINKLSDGNTTRTTLRPLAPAERIEELARMLGGVEITDRTRAHAAEMLSHGDKKTAG